MKNPNITTTTQRNLLQVNADLLMFTATQDIQMPDAIQHLTDSMELAIKQIKSDYDIIVERAVPKHLVPYLEADKARRAIANTDVIYDN